MARTNLQLKETARYTAVSDHERHKKAINAAEHTIFYCTICNVTHSAPYPADNIVLSTPRSELSMTDTEILRDIW